MKKTGEGWIILAADGGAAKIHVRFFGSGFAALIRRLTCAVRGHTFGTRTMTGFAQTFMVDGKPCRASLSFQISECSRCHDVGRTLPTVTMSEEGAKP